MKKVIMPILAMCVAIAEVHAQAPEPLFPEWIPTTINNDAAKIDWNNVPQIVYPEQNLINLYNVAWKITASRTRTGEDLKPELPAPPVTLCPTVIWIFFG